MKHIQRLRSDGTLDASRSRLTFALLAAGVLLVPSVVGAQGSRLVANAGNSNLVVDDTKLRQLPTLFTQNFLNMADFPDADAKLTTIVQRYPFDPVKLGMGRAKGRASFFVNCISQAGTNSLGTQKRKFDRYGNASRTERIDDTLDCFFFNVDVDFQGNQVQPGDSSINLMTGVQLLPDGADPDCFDPTTLCLQEGRFKVEMDWNDGRRSGDAVPLASADEFGLFYFFDPDNTEMTVKVLNSCAFNDHFWVFAAAATDVEYTLTVTDTRTAASRTYGNELGQAAAAITDTQAFATCP